MKKISIIILLIVIMITISFGYSSWKPASQNDCNKQYLTFYNELKSMYDQAVRDKAGSPDFLKDLENLLEKYNPENKNTSLNTVNYLFAIEFSSKYLKGVNVDVLKQKHRNYTIVGNRIIWDWIFKYKNIDLVKYNCLINSSKGKIEYNTETNKFIIGINDMDSLKIFLTFYSIGSPDISRTVTDWTFNILGTEIKDNVIKIEDKSLWNRYSGWWREEYLLNFNKITFYNNTKYDLKILVENLYGNEMWFKSGNKIAERNYLLPIAKRWSPFSNVDQTGRVKENGNAYLQFTTNIKSPYQIFAYATARNDNGESSKVSINGRTIVNQNNCCENHKQFYLDPDTYTVKLSGYKTWSFIGPTITMVILDGNVDIKSSKIYPDPYGDPTPMIIHIPKGVSIIGN